MKLKCGIVGLGKAGFLFDTDPLRKITWSHAKAYMQHVDTEIDFVCDVNEESYDEFEKIYGYKDYFQNYEIIHSADILSVCVPTKDHLKVIDHIVRNKLAKAIFCEKPLAYTVKECDYIINICKENNIILAVNYMRRWNRLYQETKTIIDSKKFGELISVVGYTNTALYMNASHMIDLIVWFCGDVKSVWGSFRTNYIRIVDGIADKGGIFHFKTKSNVDGMLYAYCDDVKKHQFEIDLQFQNGRIVIGDDGGWMAPTIYEPSEKVSGMLELSGKVLEPAPSERMLNAIGNIVDVLKGYKDKVDCTGEDAKKSVEFIQKCYDADRIGEVA